MSIVYLFGINIIRRTSLSGRVSNSILLGKQYSLVQTRRLIASSCNFPSSLLGFFVAFSSLCLSSFVGVDVLDMWPRISTQFSESPFENPFF